MVCGAIDILLSFATPSILLVGCVRGSTLNPHLEVPAVPTMKGLPCEWNDVAALAWWASVLRRGVCEESFPLGERGSPGSGSYSARPPGHRPSSVIRATPSSVYTVVGVGSFPAIGLCMLCAEGTTLRPLRKAENPVDPRQRAVLETVAAALP